MAALYSLGLTDIITIQHNPPPPNTLNVDFVWFAALRLCISILGCPGREPKRSRRFGFGGFRGFVAVGHRSLRFGVGWRLLVGRSCAAVV